MLTLPITMKRTNFVHTNGSVIEASYPPEFQFVAISYHWQQIPESAWWAIETPTYKALVGAFYQDHFKQLLAWVEKTMGRNRIHHVWIDAICIDQRNEFALAQQLPEITWLFNQASYVIAAPWLAHGPGAPLVQLYHEYMQRCWVVAEISSAKRVYYTGWNGRNVDHSLNDPDKEGFCPPGANPVNMTREEKGWHLDMSDRVVLLRGARFFGRFHVDEVVKMALELEATKEKDKLYALMPAAGLRVSRSRVQMDLQGCIRSLMQDLEKPIDRLRLAMAVSRFRGHATTNPIAWPSGRCPSWSFGNGSDYRSPWANDEYLAQSLGTSVTLNEDDSLRFRGRFHTCQLVAGPQTSNSSFYAAKYHPVPTGAPDTVFYHPQLDRDVMDVCLCIFGLDARQRATGIILKQSVKIGVFMIHASDIECVSRSRGTVIVQ